jgi:hypothetical protein
MRAHTHTHTHTHIYIYNSEKSKGQDVKITIEKLQLFICDTFIIIYFLIIIYPEAVSSVWMCSMCWSHDKVAISMRLANATMIKIAACRPSICLSVSVRLLYGDGCGNYIAPRATLSTVTQSSATNARRN